MSLFSAVQHNVFRPLERAGDWLMPTLARFIFAATLFYYFFNSAMTKIGNPGLGGLFTAEGLSALVTPSAGMFGQMLPAAAEAASYDVSEATFFQTAIMLSGTWAEFILPALIVIGFFTRFAAIGMVGFLGVMTFVDLYGHGGISDPLILGAWFDTDTTGIVLDQRIYWVFLLLYLFFRGAGPLSLDRLFRREHVLPHRYDE